MDAIEVFGRVIGAFYVVAGGVVLRLAPGNHTMDAMLEALSGKPDGVERRRTWILERVAILTMLGGIALAFLSRWALVLFALNIIAQIAYLAWAAKALPPESAEEARGRNQTRNALVVYMVAFVLVLALDGQGRLLPWSASGPLAAMVLVLAGATAFLWWARRGAAGLPRLPFDPATIDQEVARVPDLGPYTPPARVRLSPRRFDHSLYDADNGDGVPLNRLDLEPELLNRLYHFEDAYEIFYDDEAEVLDALVFPDEATRDDWLAEGDALAVALEGVFGPGNASFVPPAATRIAPVPDIPPP
ncbi:hypothetical protein [Zavarzinia sp. CC-PAN008]|uniref:hypothetical protein n=1 Tax=Zavarzinia sp. CC-PAN008 TaxID=3243332 RepID=UPI003F7449E0